MKTAAVPADDLSLDRSLFLLGFDDARERKLSRCRRFALFGRRRLGRFGSCLFRVFRARRWSGLSSRSVLGIG